MKKTVLLLAALFCVLASWAQQNGRFTSKAVIARDFIKPQALAAGVAVADIDQMKVSSETFSSQSGLTNVYFQQTLNGIPVYNAMLNVHITRDNKLLTYGNRFVKVEDAVRSRMANPLLNPEQAVKAAMASLSMPAAGPLVIKQSGSAPVYLTVFDKGKMSLEDIKVQLVYQPMEEKKEKQKNEKIKQPEQSQGLRLAWQVEIYNTDAKSYWSARVDASTGELLDKNNYVVTCDFGNSNDQACSHGLHEPHPAAAIPTYSFLNFRSVNNPVGSNDYRVFAQPVESPNHATPAAPADGRTLVSNPANATASPFGWHDTNGAAGAEFTTTQGNNAHAYTDVDANNTPDAGSSPDGGASLVFDFPLDLTQAPSTYRPAAVTNLFYWNNFIHDFTYLYGFDEASGNFQVNNYGNGGVGNDYVQAEAQDGSGTNNANFATPPDGSRPRMQMYIGTNPTPDVDGDFDNAVIAHEYGHGISNRLTGGPANTSCLSNVEQMGEGWSDFFGYMLTMKPTDAGTASRGIGTYLFGQPANGPGIRPTPYSTNMAVNPSTYNTIKTVAIPHGVGYVWASMLWDLNWKMIEVYGYTNGFNKTMQLVMDGMKLQPCSPGFVDGRNAILAADQALYGGVNQCLIWEVFARRGLGASATQGSSNSVQDGVQAFDMPLSCLVDVTPKKLSVCKPADAVYNVANGTGINYTMTTSGEPAGTTVTFSANPIPANSTGTMTIGNTAAAAAGTYIITVTATNGANIINQNVTLIIQSGVPAAPALTSPADGATNQISPLLTWAAVSNAETYEIQVATDAGFTNIVASATGLTNTNYQTNALANLTVHYWRVRAVNSCGNGDYAATFSFTTANIICNVTPSTNVPVAIPDLSAITSTITFATGGTISDVNVKNLGVTHTWIDDLIITLKSPAGTIVTLMNRPCGGEDNILINFDDQAVTATFPCPPTDNGTYKPLAALSAFIGQEVSGTWTLTVSDNAAQDLGTLNSWSLDICYAPTCDVAVQAPTVTQPTCATPTGTIVVNATGSGILEYSIDNGATYQASATFSGLAPGNYNIKARLQANPTCEAAYAGNPVVLTAATGCCIINPVVTNNANAGPGSLRQAVIDACPGSIITFDMNTVISPISLSGGLIRIDKNITIQGPAVALTVQNTAAKGFASRVFHVVQGASATISGLTISGANTYGTGGGIYNEGVLDLANVTISNNLADSAGAGIYNQGILSITNSTISNNLSNSNGYTGIGANGGGICTYGFLGGVTVNLTNTTISNNNANLGGGIYSIGSTVNSRNTIIAGNTVRFSYGPDFFGQVTSQGYNLVGKTDNSSGWVATDLTGTVATPLNPQLGPLADNGGPTQTLALLTGSPAINAGSNALAVDAGNNPLVFDQRGTGFPRILNGTVDIGAFEVQCIPPTITAPTITQPTCLVPTGTIVVNATGNSPLEYSVDNGGTWQPSAAFSGLAPSNYYIISVRHISNTACASTYSVNPVVIHAPVTPVVGMSADGPLTFCAGGSVNLGAVVLYPNYLRMTAPYAIDFSIGTATFGANIATTPLNGDMVYIPDGTASYLGCNPYTAGSLTGKVALIDRGTCLFVYKAKNAQDAGAIGVIIVNNTPGDPINMGSGDPSVIVTIPVISVTQQDGAILKNMIAQGTTNGNTLAHTYSYLWSNGATTQNINVTQSGTFSVQATDENGCSSTSPPETVTVNPVPDAVPTPASQSICTGSAITSIVNSGAVAGTVYNWTRDNTATVTGIAASGAGDITGTLVNTTNAAITVTFTITPSYTNEEVTCTGTPVTATVLVAPMPILRETYNGVQVTANNDGTDDVGSFAVCSSASDNVFLTEITDITNITPANSVKVEQVIIKTNVTINTAADGIYILNSVGPIPLGKTATLINPLVGGTVQIKRRAFYDANNNNSIDANECLGDWVVYNITVNPVPNAVATPASQSTCSGSAITTIVNSSAVGGTTFSWTRDHTADVTGIAANGTANISGALTNTTAAPVTVTFTITPTANGCVGEPITATVTVNPALYFACPGNMTETITDLNIPCFKAVNTPNPVFCGTLTKLTWKLTGATVLNSPTSGINYLGLRNMNVGTTTVTYTATFTGGIVKTCSFTVLVIETVPPNIYCPLDKHVNTDPGKCYKTGPVSLGTPTTSDNCGIASVTNNAPAVYNIGVNYVTWTVTDKSGNSRSCVQRVTVNDAEVPTITCPANVIANTGPVCASTPVTVPAPVFNDNCGVEKLTWTMTGVTSGGSPLTGINFVPTMNYATGVSTITYTVTDATGNAKMCSFTVTVKDVTPPTLVCTPAQTFCKVPNNTYTVPALIQSDNCVIVSTTYKITGATSRTGTGTNASGIFNQGVSTITWTVKDVNGNTSTCTTTVTVVATTNPICAAPPVTAPVAAAKTAAAEVSRLSITAWPNPSSSYFNLKVNSQAKETLEIRMIDMAGKLIEVQRGAPGDTYQFGTSAIPGVYVIEVNQAGKTLRAKVIKQ